MVIYRLKNPVLKQMRRNAELITAIVNILELSPSYVLQLIYNNDPKLTQKAVLQAISRELNLEEHELLEEAEITATPR